MGTGDDNQMCRACCFKDFPLFLADAILRADCQGFNEA